MSQSQHTGPAPFNAASSSPLTAGVDQLLVREASDPQTSATRLYELAAQFPALWDIIVLNPSVYPQLSDWIRVQQAKSVKQQPLSIEQEASDPNTPATRLHDLAAEFPVLWNDIAENPEVYPQLREWIHAQLAQAKCGTSIADAPADDTVELASTAEQEALDPRTSQDRLADLAGSNPELHAQIYANPSVYVELRNWIKLVTPSVYLEPSEIDQLVAEVQDPDTPPERLQELAAEHHFLHVGIATHRRTYEGLLQWLAMVDTPGVAQALNER